MYPLILELTSNVNLCISMSVWHFNTSQNVCTKIEPLLESHCCAVLATGLSSSPGLSAQSNFSICATVTKQLNQ